MQKSLFHTFNRPVGWFVNWGWRCFLLPQWWLLAQDLQGFHYSVEKFASDTLLLHSLPPRIFNEDKLC